MGMGWLRRLRSTILPSKASADFEEEARFHLDQRIDDYVKAGMPPEEARREAQRRLGNLTLAREQARDVDTLRWLADSVQDTRYALRRLRNSPGFSLVALVTLAFGIGATTAIFSVVNSVLIQPLPYRDSDALVRIVHAIGGTDQTYFNDQIFVGYDTTSQTLSDVGVWSPAAKATVTGRGEPEEVRTLPASEGVLTTLGVQPEIGRAFSVGDDTPGAPDVVILTYGYWQRAFGGDRGVLEHTLTIDARPHQIIGVMPAGFSFGGEPDLLLPLRINRGRMVPFFRLLGIARLNPGTTLEQANIDASRILGSWLDDTGQKDPAFRARYQPALRPLKQDVVGDVRATLWVLMGTIGLVLLMACANVANLLLIRANARQQEFAIRAALGARWTRVARALLVESLTLTVLGGVLGVAVAYGSLRVLVAFGPSDLPRLSEIAIHPLVLAFALTISVLSGLLFGLVPILRFIDASLPTAAGRVGHGRTRNREHQHSQHTLVTVQIALALVLVVSAGLMIRSFQALRRVDPGFTQPEQVQTFGLMIPATVIPNRDRVTQTQQAILDRIGGLPGIRSVAFTTRLPMDFTDRWSNAIAAEGQPDDGRTPPNRHLKLISPGMFQTQGTPLVAGRDFTWTDLHAVGRVAIVSENLAREFWGSPQNALGKRVREYYGPPQGP
jgi:predicted permease